VGIYNGKGRGSSRETSLESPLLKSPLFMGENEMSGISENKYNFPELIPG